MNRCEELFLNDVVRVEVVPASRCSFSVPPNVGEITEISQAAGSGGQAGLSGLAAVTMDIDDGTATALMESVPTLKIQERTQMAGFLRQADLQIPIAAGFQEIRQANGSLKGEDFHVVLKTASGTRLLLYALPDSSAMTVEESASAQTVKITLMSMSSLIKII